MSTAQQAQTQAQTSDAALLQTYLRQQQIQNEATQQLLKNIEESERTTSYSVVRSSRDIRTERKIAQFRLIGLIAVIVGLSLFVFSTLASIRSRFKYMIDQIDGIRNASGSNYAALGGPSGMTVAFAYCYPGLAVTIPAQARNFPIACVYAFYNSTWAGYLQSNGDLYLSTMWSLAQGTSQANLNNGEPLDATQIVCDAIGAPNHINQCSPSCPPAQKAGAYLSSSLSMGLTGAFLGQMAAGALGAAALGPIGLGFLIFAGIGGGIAYLQGKGGRTC